MEETRFADIGKEEAIRRFYEGTGFEPFKTLCFQPARGGFVTTVSRVLMEGVNFNLEYFPLKHLGYKAVTGVTGDLCAKLSHPETLSVIFGLSAKLDYEQAKEIWSGVVVASKEFGYKQVNLDLVPSKNGLYISMSAAGVTSELTYKRRPAMKAKDLICVSGSLGAAYLGMQLLEKRGDLEKNRMLVGAYVKPELDSDIVARFEDSEIYPAYGCFITEGLSSSVKRLCEDSLLGAKIYVDKIPFEGNSFQVGKEMNIDPISAAMEGGDDYKLLFVVPILSLEKFRHDFQTFDIIGHLAMPDVGAVLVTPDGLEHSI